MKQNVDGTEEMRMTNDINGKWVFNNFEEDIWNKSDLYDSREECIKAAEDYFDSDESIFIGQSC